MKKILGLFLALVSACALAASQNNVTITWTAPTQFTDGSSIGSAPVTYNLYGALSGVPLQQLATGLTNLSTVRTNVNPGNQCYALTAVVGGVESAQSNVSCVNVVAPIETPNSPSGVVVTVTVVVTP